MPRAIKTGIQCIGDGCDNEVTRRSSRHCGTCLSQRNLRECTSCRQMRRHFARGLCGNCYQKYRQSGHFKKVTKPYGDEENIVDDEALDISASIEKKRRTSQRLRRVKLAQKEMSSDVSLPDDVTPAKPTPRRKTAPKRKHKVFTMKTHRRFTQSRAQVLKEREALKAARTPKPLGAISAVLKQAQDMLMEVNAQREVVKSADVEVVESANDMVEVKRDDDVIEISESDDTAANPIPDVAKKDCKRNECDCGECYTAIRGALIRDNQLYLAEWAASGRAKVAHKVFSAPATGIATPAPSSPGTPIVQEQNTTGATTPVPGPSTSKQNNNKQPIYVVDDAAYSAFDALTKSNFVVPMSEWVPLTVYADLKNPTNYFLVDGTPVQLMTEGMPPKANDSQTTIYVMGSPSKTSA